MLKLLISIVLMCGIIGCNASPVPPRFISIQKKSVALIPPEKWTVLTYFSEWCHSCTNEVEHLNHLHAEGKVAVYGVYYAAESPEKLAKHAKDMGIHYDILTEDPSAALGLAPIRGIPTHYVLSPAGEHFGPVEGALRDEDLVRYQTQSKTIAQVHDRFADANTLE